MEQRDREDINTQERETVASQFRKPTTHTPMNMKFQAIPPVTFRAENNVKWFFFYNASSTLQRGPYEARHRWREAYTSRRSR